MKKKWLALALAATMSVSVLAGCGAEESTTTSNEQTEVVAEAEAETETETTTEDVAESEGQSLASELITRHATPDDVITADVIEEVIDLLKETYTFEDDVKEIKYAADFQTYIGDGKGWFEKLFGDAGIQVARVDDAQDQEAVLMDRGDLHFANRMLYPYLTYVANGTDVTAFYETRNPQKEIISILVKADSPYQEFADLEGKSIAARSSGCQYAALLELADNQGWTMGEDWTFVDTKELKEALLAGEVDAISTHPRENINSIMLSGETRVISNALPDGIYVNAGGARVVFGPTEFVANHPNIVRAYSKLYELISAYTLNNSEEAAGIIEGVTRVPSENNIFWWENSSYTHYFTDLSFDQVKENMQAYADWLVEHDGNFTEPIDVLNSNAFDEQYFN